MCTEWDITTDFMRISSKLFLSVLGLTSIILLATLSLARWSFERGFLDFITLQEKERLQSIADDLIEYYQQHNRSWGDLTQQDLESYLSRHFPAQRPRPQNRPPPRFPPLADKNANLIPYQDKPKRRRDIGPPTALFGVDGLWLAGENNPPTKRANIRLPLYIEGDLIGELQSWPSPLASAFSREQLWTSIFIGLFSLLIACLMSWMLAQWLLKPLRLLLSGVSQLSRGDYSLRYVQTGKDELGQLMDDVQNLAQTLDKNRTAKNRWLADISHELRTPLSILYGEIDALKAGIRPFDQQQLDSLEQEISLMNHLVNDLYELSLSDIGGLRYVFAPTNLNECLVKAINSLGNQIEAKGLTLNIQSKNEPWLEADHHRLEQLCINLLKNALTYTDAPGQIAVSVQKTEFAIKMRVEDSMPSVPEAECELLFEPLYRQDSARTRRKSGAGLGLSICKNITEAHNGKISAHPSRLGGLLIEIELPTKREIT